MDDLKARLEDLAADGFDPEAALVRKGIAEIARLEARVAELEEVRRIFVGCAYPVATEIHPRGYNWSEAYLDQALANAHRRNPDASSGLGLATPTRQPHRLIQSPTQPQPVSRQPVTHPA